jgi:hypothetical protein
VSSTQTLKAIATATGYTTSAVATAAYTITSPAATPTFSPAAGTYTSAKTVTISDATAGSTIYYTTNGSTPTTSSTRYTGAITVSSTQTLKAIATATGYTTSVVATAAYTITPPAATPTFSPVGGTYTTKQTVINKRCHRWRHHLLHHQRKRADDELNQIHRNDHDIGDGDPEGSCNRSWICAIEGGDCGLQIAFQLNCSIEWQRPAPRAGRCQHIE